MNNPFRDVSHQRLVKFLIWLLVISFVLVLLVCLFVPIIIDRNLARAEARLSAEGEKTDYLSLLPPSLPFEGNFFALRELQNLPLVDAEDASTKVHEEHRAPLLKMGEGLEKIPYHLIANPGLAQNTDWPGLATQFLGSGFLSGPAPKGQEALFIRQTLEEKHPLLLKLAKQATISTHAEFVPSFAKRPIPEILVGGNMKHLNCLQNASLALKLHALTCCDAGDIEAAIRDLQALHFIASAFQREPSILTQLVSQTMLSQSLPIAWTILEGQKFKGQDLALLEASFRLLQQESAMLSSCRGELCIGIQVIDHLIQNPSARKGVLSGLAERPKGMNDTMPEWFLKLNKATLINLELEGWLLPMKRGGLASGLKQAVWLQNELESHGYALLNAYKLLPLFLIPTSKAVFEMSLYAEAQRRQMLAACALERHFLEHRRYPATLAELGTPAPIDPMSGKPFSYKPIPGGRYQIWSFGMDGDDDQGDSPLGPSDKPSKLTKSDYQGDWTWRYEWVK